MMTKYVQAYFRTEDEAEQLRATLSKFATSNVMLDQLEADGKNSLVVPYIPFEGAGTTTGNAELGLQAVSYRAVEDDQENRNIVISFDVAESDLYNVLVEIQKLDGHVDKSIFV